MSVALVWLAIAVMAVIVEVVARRGGSYARIGELGRLVTSRRLGRLVLVACWAFIGWHLFARYTVPPL
ncbi:MAG: DUF6186 family protein [Acidimicrobiales bacterium]